MIDAHLHLVYAHDEDDTRFFSEVKTYRALSCAHEKSEFAEQEKLSARYNQFPNVKIFQSFGMHPQLPLLENADFLEAILREKKITAIGETGFDLFTKQFKETLDVQMQAWRISLSLAKQFSLPIIVHARKANEKIFSFSRELSKLPAVIFHSFMGSSAEAESLLKKNINAFFSFGNPLFFGDKSAIACVKELPLETLLLETDAPYQTLRGENKTKISAIKNVYEKAFALRNEKNKITRENFFSTIEKNFSFVLSLKT